MPGVAARAEDFAREHAVADLAADAGADRGAIREARALAREREADPRRARRALEVEREAERAALRLLGVQAMEGVPQAEVDRAVAVEVGERRLRAVRPVDAEGLRRLLELVVGALPEDPQPVLVRVLARRDEEVERTVVAEVPPAREEVSLVPLLDRVRAHDAAL